MNDMIDRTRWTENPDLTGERDSPEWNLTILVWQARILHDHIWQGLSAPGTDEEIAQRFRVFAAAHERLHRRERKLVDRMYVPV